MNDNVQVITQNAQSHNSTMLIIIIIVIILALVMRLCDSMGVKLVCMFIIIISMIILLDYIVFYDTQNNTNTKIPRLIETGETSSNCNQKMLDWECLKYKTKKEVNNND